MKRMLLWLALAAGPRLALAAGLTVQPNPALVQTGGTVVFAADTDSSPGKVEWQVVPPWLGTVDEGGRFTASDKPGQGMVRAVSGRPGHRLVGHAMISVAPQGDARLEVSVIPSAARAELGSPARFRAEVRKIDGEDAENPAITWKVVPEDLGTIDAGGTFIPQRVGRGRIAALARTPAGRGMAQARLEVLSPREDGRLSLSLEPRRLRLEPGASLRTSVEVRDAAGNQVQAALSYRVDPPGLGAVASDGTFTASAQAGHGVLTATAFHRGAFGQARSLVTVAVGTGKYRVQLRPKTALLAPSQSADFEPLCLDADGNQVQPPYWVWKVVPPGLGTITPEGIFTAGDKAAQGKLVASLPAEFGQGQDFASVRVKPGRPWIVRVSPAKVLVRPGESRKFTASVSRPGEKPLDNPRLVWKVAPEGLGSISPDGLFTAGPTPRMGTVVAMLPREYGGGRGYAGVGVSNYAVQILGSRPRHLSAEEVHQFQAEVRDQSGSLVTGAVFEWSSSSLYPNFGAIDPASGVFTAGTPAAQQAEGNVLVRIRIDGHLAGGDGIRVIVHRP